MRPARQEIVDHLCRIVENESGRTMDYLFDYVEGLVGEAREDIRAELREATGFLAAALYGQWDGIVRADAAAFLLRAHDVGDDAPVTTKAEAEVRAEMMDRWCRSQGGLG